MAGSPALTRKVTSASKLGQCVCSLQAALLCRNANVAAAGHLPHSFERRKCTWTTWRCITVRMHPRVRRHARHICILLAWNEYAMNPHVVQADNCLMHHQLKSRPRLCRHRGPGDLSGAGRQDGRQRSPARPRGDGERHPRHPGGMPHPRRARRPRHGGAAEVGVSAHVAGGGPGERGKAAGRRVHTTGDAQYGASAGKLRGSSEVHAARECARCDASNPLFEPG